MPARKLALRGFYSIPSEQEGMHACGGGGELGANLVKRRTSYIQLPSGAHTEHGGSQLGSQHTGPRGPEVQRDPQLHSEFESSQGYMRPSHE